MRRIALLSAPFAVALALASPATAQEATGNWLRPSTGSVLNFYSCGANLCAKVASVKDPAKKDTVGKVILTGAVKDGANSWKGSLLNLDDGKTYTGIITLSGGGLNLKGCALGGLVCKDETLTKAR
jgi:uncharacterized protein (DUF2147 family)